MKYFLISFLLIISSNISFGQEVSADLKQNFSKLLCNCFEKNQNFESPQFQNCFQNEMQNSEEIYMEAYLNSGYKSSEEFGAYMMSLAFENLVMDCDSFYNYFETQNKSAFTQAKNTLQKEDFLKALEETQTNPNSEAYLKVGFYYLLNDKIKKLKKTF